MKKKIMGYIKLTVPAGKANPSKSIGSALGQKKLNIKEFCDAFNTATAAMESGIPVPVIITVYEGNSFTFVTKTSPASHYLKQFAKVDKGASATKKEAFIGKVTMADCIEIAKIKMVDLNTDDLMAAARIIRGSAESMGLEVVGD